MKILYISPENTVGTMQLYQRIHEMHGNECRFVTFFHSPKGFQEDICLELPFNFTKPLLKKIRHRIYQVYRGKDGYHTEKSGYPPTWSPEGKFDAAFLSWKEKRWTPYVEKAVLDHDLYNFDVYHFESGMDFYKNARFAKELKKRGKRIVCHYHGEDLRARGVLEPLDKLSDLNLTNEVDLLKKHPNINYIFLPFDIDGVRSRYLNQTKTYKLPLITHAPTNRYYKGSKYIIPVCEALQREGLCRFELIENMSHERAMLLKSRSDVFIDQVGDKGGWGYGMNSVESLALGICTVTEMNDAYCKFIPDHPFYNVNPHNLDEKLRELLLSPKTILDHSKKGFTWVKKYHDFHSVGTQLYKYYGQMHFEE